MPRGSRPGERRGGRKRGTPNKKTALKNAVFLAAAGSPDSSPLDFMLRLMRDPDVPKDLRIDMAAAAAPYVHSRPRKERVKPLDLTTRIERRLKVSDEEVEAKLRPVELLSGHAAPLGFLAGVMNDADATPQQRIKAAKLLARYRNIPGQPDMFASLVDDPFGFSCDLEVASEIRHCHLRLVRMRRRHSNGMPIEYTGSDIREAEIIRERMAGLKAGLKRCPSYSREARLTDDRRLDELAAKRGRGILTPEEEIEEAYLFARIESYIETDEEAATRIHREINRRRSFKDQISPVEEKEFEEIERRYPHLKPQETELPPYMRFNLWEIEPYGYKEEREKNLQSGMSGLGATLRAMETAGKRLLAQRQLEDRKKRSKDDKSAGKEENEKAEVDSENRPLMNEAATIMGNKGAKGGVKHKARIQPTLEEMGLPEDFQEFLDE